jgi:hypothetical protein
MVQLLDRTPTNWKIGTYRKPTFTDTIIPYSSNHPTQHKYATIRFLYNRLITYDLQEDDYNTEITTSQNILHNNAFPIHPPIRKPPPDTNKKQTMTTHTQIPSQKWATFTYVRKETTFITDLFKKTDIKFVFRTNNNIQKLLMHKQQVTDIQSQSAVYKLTCPDLGRHMWGRLAEILPHGSKSTKTPSEQPATHLTSPNT